MFPLLQEYFYLFLVHVIFPFLSNMGKLWENFHVYYLSSLLSGLEVSTPHGPELHLDVAAQQEHLLLLGMPILQRHVLHLDIPAKQRPAPGHV